MSKLINLTQGKYTVVPDNIIRDKELGLKARGMLVTLLNLAEKEKWQFSERGLAALFDTEGRVSIRSALKELEGLGYLRRVQMRGVGGLMGHIDYYITTQKMDNCSWEKSIENEPMSGNRTLVEDINSPWVENRTTVASSPWFGFPTTDKPTSVNRTQYEKGIKNEFQ